MRKNFCAVLRSAAICLIRSFFLCSTCCCGDYNDDYYDTAHKNADDKKSVCHLIPPEPILIELGEAIHHNWYRQSQDEDTREGAEPTNQFPWEISFSKWRMILTENDVVCGPLFFCIQSYNCMSSRPLNDPYLITRTPSKVRGLRSYPTVVIVIRPHLQIS